MKRYSTYPLAVFFGLGVFFAGLIPVVGLAPTSPSVVLLPEWLRLWWQIFYTFGGLGLALGVLGRRPGIEALGLAFLGGPFAIQAYLAVAALGPAGVPGAVFLAFISAGCWVRFWLVMRKELV